jgi:sodium transport system permease protein
MKWSIVFAIFAKEVKDTLRDRRTLFIMTILPILLYPIMIVGFLHISAMLKQSLDKERFKVWVEGIDQIPQELKDQLSKGNLEDQKEDPNGGSRAKAKLDVVGIPAGVKDIAIAFKEKRVDAVLRVPSNFRRLIKEGRQGRLLITYNKGFDKSSLAYEEIIKGVQRYAGQVRADRLGRRKIARSFFEPVKIEGNNLGQENVELLRSLSMILIIMALTGAFYPALDLGAGEKERGTLETLLVTPASRAELAWGKYLAVAVLAISAGLLNVGSMALTFLNLESLVPADIPQATNISIDVQAVFSMTLVLIPLVGLFSALALAVSTYAASYKEGQNYLSPLMLIVIFPAMAAALPGVTLSPGMCLIPVMGAAVLFRDLLSDSAWAYQVVLVSLSNFFYAWLAIRWVATLYQREEVLMRPAAVGSGHFLPGLQKLKARFFKAPARKEESASGLGWQDLPEGLRPGPPLPGLSQSFLAFALAFAGVWFFGLRLQADDFIYGPVITAFGVLGIGGVFAALSGCELGSAFYLARPRLPLLIAAVFLGLGVYCLNVEIQLLQQTWFSGLGLPRVAPGDFKELGLKIKTFTELGTFKLLLFFAVVPALCYEPLFRGLIFNGLKRDLGLWSGIGASAVLGALLNFSPIQFVPMLVLGALSAALVYAGRSIAPAVVLHAICQGIKAYYSSPKAALSQKFLIKISFSDGQASIILTTAGWICGLLALLIGMILLIWQMRLTAGSSSAGKSL